MKTTEKHVLIIRNRLAIVICLTMCLFYIGTIAMASGVQPNAGGTWNNLNWTYNNGVLTISGTGEMNDFSNQPSDQPWRGYFPDIKSIVIEEGITSIGNNAFYSCHYVTSVTIPASMVSIGDDAFYYNHIDEIHISSLESWLTIDYGNWSSHPNCGQIRQCHLYIGNNELTSIEIPSGVTSLGECAFYNFTDITNITIPSGVTSIGNEAFFNCRSLANITIPSSVTSIGGRAFYDCVNLTSIAIPPGVTDLIGSTFCGCRNLTSITLPDSLEFIAGEDFCGCCSLTSITIPRNVTYIGSYTFQNCSALKTIFFMYDSKYYQGYSWENNIIDSGSLPSLTIYCHHDQYPYEWAMSCGYTTICFEDLKTLHLPANLTEIPAEAFAGVKCEAVIIPQGCKRIGAKAFSGSKKLVYVRIPKSVTSIAPDAFEGCGNVVLDRVN